MKNWPLTIVIFGSYMVFSMIYFAILGFNADTLKIQLQLSARVSFLIFAITFSALPIFKISENSYTKWLTTNRKYLIVTFALIHFYHLVLIVTKNYYFEPILSEISFLPLFIGVVTYCCIFLMFITSLPIISKKLNFKDFSKLHSIGGYLVLIVFTFFYVQRTMQEIFYLPLLILAIIVWLLRLLFNKAH